MDRLTCGKRGFPLTNLEYDAYLATLADLEGLEGVEIEARRQRAAVRHLEEQIHRADARAARATHDRDLRRKQSVLTELLADVVEQQNADLERRARLLEKVLKDEPEDRFYCPCDRYCQYVGEHRAARRET